MAKSTSELIRAAALEVFSERGYKGATMSEVAARAGIAPGTIYRYFKDKEDLFGSLDRPDLLFPTAAHQERERAILEAALAVFGSKGFQGACLEQIAEEAGISKATIYLYFGNKEELFAALIRHHTPTTKLLERFERDELSRDVAENLRALALAFLSQFDNPDRANMLRLMLGEADRFPEVAKIFFSEVMGRGIRVLSNYFRQLVARGDLKVADAEFAARVFLGTLVSLVIQNFIIKEAVGGELHPLPDKGKMSVDLVALFLHGAAGRGEGRARPEPYPEPWL